jgi:Elongation factor Tu GTP binding domain
VVFIGHVDAGKSTIGGQILFLTGGVDERTIQKYERYVSAPRPHLRGCSQHAVWGALRGSWLVSITEVSSSDYTARK